MSDEVTEQETAATKSKADRREIKGNIPYVTATGVLKKCLESIISAERPDKFAYDFLEQVLKISGGSARSLPPFFKKMGFISSDGSPTELYSKFKTDSGRSYAAYHGLKNAFSELFKRKDYIHKADEATVKDVIVEITGLKKSDSLVRSMYQSFDAIRSFIDGNFSLSSDDNFTETEDSSLKEMEHDFANSQTKSTNSIGLSYNINIVLPETDNISVFNAIFKSLKENLL